MISPFDLYRPSTVLEASAAMVADDDAVFYAGGTELLILMKNRLLEPTLLVDLKHIPGLRGITVDGGTLVIGGLTTHRDLEQSSLVAKHLPVLGRVESEVANVRVRTAGSLGGNLCFAEPHSDPATILIALDATVALESVEGEREVPLGQFFTGFLSTVRRREEVMTEIRVPLLGPTKLASYARFKSHERPDASAAVVISVEEGIVTGARVVLGCIGDVPQRIKAAEAGLVGAAIASMDAAKAIEATRESVEADDDPMMSAAYKRQLAGSLVRRAIEDLVGSERAVA